MCEEGLSVKSEQVGVMGDESEQVGRVLGMQMAGKMWVRAGGRLLDQKKKRKKKVGTSLGELGYELWVLNNWVWPIKINKTIFKDKIKNKNQS